MKLFYSTLEALQLLLKATAGIAAVLVLYTLISWLISKIAAALFNDGNVD